MRLHALLRVVPRLSPASDAAQQAAPERSEVSSVASTDAETITVGKQTTPDMARDVEWQKENS